MSRITSHESRVTPSDLWTVVPVRGIVEGKSRLAGVLDPAARARLNRRLLASTLDAIGKWRGDLGRCVVVSSCRETLATAAHLGAAVLDEGAEARGLNAAAARGTDHARSRGALSALVLACDLPCLNAGALGAMLGAAASERHLVIAPDRHGTGTNALLLNAREPFDFHFGETSCAKHIAAATGRGWQVALCRRPELEFDLDTPEYLAACPGWVELEVEPAITRPPRH